MLQVLAVYASLIVNDECGGQPMGRGEVMRKGKERRWRTDLRFSVLDDSV